jgi:phage gpG-like protein
VTRFSDDAVRVDGLKELRKALKDAEDATPTVLRAALNEAAQVVVKVAKPRLPHRTGALANTLKVASSQTKAQVALGSTRVPYAGWVDFGGKRPHERPYKKSGRYVLPAYESQKDNITKLLQARLDKLVKDAGLDVG